MADGEYVEVPKQVSLAINLLWGSFWLFIGKLIWTFSIASSISSTPFSGSLEGPLLISTVLMFLVSGAVVTFIAGRISAGKNWSRIVFAICFVLSILDTLSRIGILLKNPLQPDALAIAQLCLQGYAIKLLFTVPGRDWFLRSKEFGQPT